MPWIPKFAPSYDISLQKSDHNAVFFVIDWFYRDIVIFQADIIEYQGPFCLNKFDFYSFQLFYSIPP